MKIHNTIADIAQKYRGVLLDAYGVFWGGNAYGALLGAKEEMARLVEEGKIVGVLSNATQLGGQEAQKVGAQGIFQGKHYHFYLTSGDCVRLLFSQEKLPFSTPKKKFWVFGGDHPRISSFQHLFSGSVYSKAETLEDADFIYIGVPHIAGEDQTDPELFRAEVQEIKRRVNIPMVCANCDLFAHEGNPPQLMVRQGSIAQLYRECGGEVFYVGKPWPFVYEQAMRLFQERGIADPKEVIMVGDTPETDVRGAVAFGMDAALILETGVMQTRPFPYNLNQEDHPHYFIKRLGNK